MNMNKIINMNERQLTDELIYSKMYVDEKISYNKKRDTFNIPVLDVLLEILLKENTVSKDDSVFSFKISPF